MYVEHATGIVHHSILNAQLRRAKDPRLVLMKCGVHLYAPYEPLVLCPCVYHAPQIAPTMPSNQKPCPGCFPDGTGWHPVAVRYRRPPG